eukprot:TRINITY_DN15990_c0_g1_i1.p1 TRINITY_DN15990_c0_g1~~TRINITY_DN15990_c0_g1_i1.p1  ORF type:complete len:755 (+),score=95.72 TRINITY_DN15990_c0_g1_i1:226-2265(+)
MPQGPQEKSGMTRGQQDGRTPRRRQSEESPGKNHGSGSDRDAAPVVREDVSASLSAIRSLITELSQRSLSRDQLQDDIFTSTKAIREDIVNLRENISQSLHKELPRVAGRDDSRPRSPRPGKGHTPAKILGHDHSNTSRQSSARSLGAHPPPREETDPYDSSRPLLDRQGLSPQESALAEPEPLAARSKRSRDDVSSRNMSLIVNKNQISSESFGRGSFQGDTQTSISGVDRVSKQQGARRRVGRKTTRGLYSAEDHASELELGLGDGGKYAHKPFSAVLKEFVRGPTFNHTSLVVLVLYALFVVVETEHRARCWQLTEIDVLAFQVECAFACIFFFEILLRVWAHEMRFFKGPSSKGNLFDLGGLFLQAIGLVVTYVCRCDLPFLRPVKLIRCMRLVRAVHLVDELQTLTSSIACSLKPFFWSMLLLLLSTLVFGVIVTNWVIDSKRQMIKLDEDFESTSLHDKLEESFGTLGSSMMVMYQTISEGLPWSEVVVVLQAMGSPGLVGLVIVYVSFMLFVMLNVVTAFFVDATIRAAEEDSKRIMMSELWRVFRPADSEEDDPTSYTITLTEFQKHLDNPKMKAFLKALDLDAESALESPFFHLIDSDGSGEVDLDELVSGCLRLTGGAKSFDVLSLYHDHTCYAGVASARMEMIENSITRIESACVEGREHADSPGQTW